MAEPEKYVTVPDRVLEWDVARQDGGSAGALRVGVQVRHAVEGSDRERAVLNQAAEMVRAGCDRAALVYLVEAGFGVDVRYPGRGNDGLAARVFAVEVMED